MSLNFPSSPTPGQTFTSQGVTFVWTGTVWVVPPSGLLFATQAEAEAGERWDRGMSPLTGAQAIDAIYVPPTPVTPPAAVCVAMCIFNGQTGQIFFEKNIASLAGAGSGVYTLTLRNPMVDANAIVLGSCVGVSNHPVLSVGPRQNLITAEVVVVQVGTTGGNLVTQNGFLVAAPLIHVGVFR